MALDGLEAAVHASVGTSKLARSKAFGDAGHDIRLEHLRTTTYESGFVQSTYRVAAPLATATDC